MNQGEQSMPAPRRLLPRWTHLLTSFFRSVKIRRSERKLRLCESLALGEKRFLAVVQCEHERFLVGVTNQSVSLLHRLDGAGNAGAAETKFLAGVTESE